MTRIVKAWHFLRQDGRLRDGSEPPPDDEWLEHDGPVVMCESGLHASRRALDALSYATGPVVCRVEMADVVVADADKLVGRRRRILWRADATETLRRFARRCALDMAHLWDPPDVVLRYLRHGREEDRDATLDAAWNAAGDASRSAPAGNAARNASRAATRNAAWSAANAARDADAARETQNRRLASINRRLASMLAAAGRATP